MSNEPPLPEHLDGANFIEPERVVKESNWSRDPSDYTPSRTFTQRFKELGSAVTEEYITGAIRYGRLWGSANDTVAFVNNLNGVVVCVIAAYEEDTGARTLVSVWPYVYNKTEAWATGRWSSKELKAIQSIEPEDWI